MIKRTLYFGKAKLSKSFKTFGKFILADVLMSIKEPAMIKRNSISETPPTSRKFEQLVVRLPEGEGLKLLESLF
jgi:hypothetical protein